MSNIANYYKVNSSARPVFASEDTVAYLSNKSGMSQIYLYDLKTGEIEQLTDLGERVLSLSEVVHDGKLFFTSDAGGNEQEQIHMVSIATGEVKNLTNNPKARFSLGGVLNGGKEIIMSSNARNAANYDICKLNLETGETEILVQNDDNYNLPSALSPDGKFLLYNKMIGSSQNYLWMLNIETLETVRIHPEGSHAVYRHPCFTKDSRGFYLATDVDSNFVYIAHYDIDKKELTKVYTENWNIDGICLSYDDKYMAICINEDGYTKLRVLNLNENHFENHVQPPMGHLGGVVFSSVDYGMLFTVSSVKRPTNIWYMDITKDMVKRLTSTNFEDISPDSLVEPDLQRYTSFDGLSVPYWLFKRHDVPAEAPVIIQIHGGPEAQDLPTYKPLVAYLVNEGFIVVSPNVRGSTGYGKEYHHMDDVEKRLDSVKDISSLVEHLISSGIATKGKIGVMGGSYGGFMTLACITNYPGMFNAAIDTVGIANFETFLENTSEYRRAHRESEYGSLKEHRHILREISPIHKVSEIITPLMVIHGANDPRVPVSEAEQIVESLRKREVSVEYLCYADEGHGLAKRKNQLDCYPRVADFLKKHLL